MKPKEFVESTWLNYSDVTSNCVLMDLNAYIKFQFLNHITKEVAAEKLYDHFRMVELTNKCDFNKLIKSYFKCLNEILESQIETSKQKTRAQKYYEKAVSISKSKEVNFQDLVDYTRIMMCLYMAVTKNHSKLISDFDLSKECLDMDTILTFIRRETVPAIGINKRKPRFDFHNSYSMDSCILLILTLVLYKLKDGE
ncbi:hypothetical protein [uncultured Holdemanella sp.]|mgnify:FL=1|uniref:hypothetical protein n=1 Tax=uncultured Holdemanella sp. TaxID=1763549 RepID=UPI0025F0928A|nr:hypothetical protein [uncultured Holdemanella sp.]